MERVLKSFDISDGATVDLEVGREALGVNVQLDVNTATHGDGVFKLQSVMEGEGGVDKAADITDMTHTIAVGSDIYQFSVLRWKFGKALRIVIEAGSNTSGTCTLTKDQTDR